MQAAKTWIYRCAAPLLSPLYGGVGSIAMFHRIVDETPATRVGWCRTFENTASELERMVRVLRRRGYGFVSLDEVHEILRRPRRVPRFVSFTFDDGYRDTYTRAFPLLTAEKVPFTLYLTTGFPDKTVLHWPYLLEELLGRLPSLEIELDDRLHEFPLRSRDEREAAFAALARQFETLPAADGERLAQRLFGAEAVLRSHDELSIAWDEVATMSRDPLITIGAHTINHPNLASLPFAEARREIEGSKAIIEARLGREVRHFAFPHGTAQHAGERESELARAAGFATATTTRTGNLFPGHGASLHCLPRVCGADVREISLQLSGAVSAFRYRGRRLVTA